MQAQKWKFGVLSLMFMMLFPFLVLLVDIDNSARRPVLSALRSSFYQSGKLFPVPFIGNMGNVDDPKCLSRTQHASLYRSNSKPTPMSRSLKEALARYQELHNSCSFARNWTDLFLKGEEDNNCKYLIFYDSGLGTGNNIISLVTAFLYALLTDRMLLIDARSHLAKLLCEPFPGSSWLLPEDFPHNETLQDSLLLGPSMARQFNSSIVYLKLVHVRSSGDQQFFCDHVQRSLRRVKWISWLSNQYYVPMLFAMPIFWERANLLFPAPNHVFTQLSHFLLLPANDVWALILREYYSYFSCAETRIGLQIRPFGRPDQTSFEKEEFNKIFGCLVSMNLLPNVTERENATLLSSLYSRKMRLGWKDGEPSADITVLVVSLQGKYFEEIRDIYSRHPTKDGSTVRVHSMSQEGHQNKSLRQALLAFAEMWLLSYADRLVTSASSTFGYIAQGMGELHPHILNTRDRNKNMPACFVGTSFEPCTHAPRRPPCLGANMTAEHREWIKRHVRSCQDRGGALQLAGPEQSAENYFFGFHR